MCSLNNNIYDRQTLLNNFSKLNFLQFLTQKKIPHSLIYCIILRRVSKHLGYSNSGILLAFY